MTAAAFEIPDCEGLSGWIERGTAAEPRRVNETMSLSGLFGDELSTGVFGNRAIDWSSEDVKALNVALAGCGKEARRAKDKDVEGRFNVARNAVNKEIRNAVVRIERARAAVAEGEAVLLAAPASAEFYLALGDLPGVGADIVGRAPRRQITPEAAVAIRTLGQQVVYMPEEEWAETTGRLNARRDEIKVGLLDEVRTEIANAPESADGLLSTREMMSEIDTRFGNGLDDAERADIAKAVEGRSEAIRAALAASGGFQPPTCEDLFRWGATIDWSRARNTRQGPFYLFMLDDRIVPVFGRSIRDWDEADAAAYDRLYQSCEARARSGDPALLELYRNRGANARGPAARLQQNVPALEDYYEALAALEENQGAIAGVSVDRAGLDALQGLVNDPRLAALDQDERRQLNIAVGTKREQIAREYLKPDIERLSDFDDDLEGLKALSAYAAERRADYARFLRPIEWLPFDQAYRKARATVAEGAFEEYQDYLADLPENAESIATIDAAVQSLAVDGMSADLGPFVAASQKRAADILTAVREKECRDVQDEADLGSRDRKRIVLGPDGKVELGRMVCALARAGNKVHEFDDGDDDTYELKLTSTDQNYQTVIFHEAEIGPDETGLVGKAVSDANGRHELSLLEWKGYIATMLAGQSGLAALSSGAAAYSGNSAAGIQPQSDLRREYARCRTRVRDMEARNLTPETMSAEEKQTLVSCLVRFGQTLATTAIEDGRCEQLLAMPESQLSPEQRDDALACTMFQQMLASE
ncbi:hypothetical protein [Oceanibacterium hippocampi]|nr:hypothetical protein [Oceanibacterium hippocampi]